MVLHPLPQRRRFSHPPSEAPHRNASWDSLDERDEDFAPAYTCIERLRELGLNGRHVVLDFLRCAVAPLQERSHPMWAYQGPLDRTRLREAYAAAGRKIDMGRSCLRFRARAELLDEAVAAIIADTPVDALIAGYEASRAK